MVLSDKLRAGLGCRNTLLKSSCMFIVNGLGHAFITISLINRLKDNVAIQCLFLCHNQVPHARSGSVFQCFSIAVRNEEINLKWVAYFFQIFDHKQDGIFWSSFCRKKSPCLRLISVELIQNLIMEGLGLGVKQGFLIYPFDDICLIMIFIQRCCGACIKSQRLLGARHRIPQFDHGRGVKRLQIKMAIGMSFWTYSEFLSIHFHTVR